MLQDIVVIIEIYFASYKASGFGVYYFRFNSEAAKDLVLSGRPLPELSSESLIIQGQITPSDQPIPGALDEALNAAKAALANPNSGVRRQGFHPMTPIYIWKWGQQAQKLT